MATLQVPILQTTKGQLTLEQALKQTKAVLMHEILTPLVHPTPSNRPLNLEHRRFHLEHPVSLENMSLTAPLLEHEMQAMVAKLGLKPSELVVLDGSNYKHKVHEIFDKYTVVKGYNYFLDKTGDIPANHVLLSQAHVLKQVQYQFKYGNGSFKPGFIGQLPLQYCIKSSIYRQAFIACLKYSAHTNCPVIINALPVGEQAVRKVAILNERSNQVDSFVEECYSQVFEVLTLCKEVNAAKVVFYNLPIVVTSRVNLENQSIATVHQTHSKIQDLLNLFNFKLGFDLTRYSQCHQALTYLAMIALHQSERVLFSAGIRFKTDLQLNGGQGLAFYTNQSQTSQSLSHLLRTQGVAQKMWFSNKMELLKWKIRLQEEKVVMTWTCMQCKREVPQTQESFRKFGKEFCSIKCLKAHKF